MITPRMTLVTPISCWHLNYHLNERLQTSFLCKNGYIFCGRTNTSILSSFDLFTLRLSRILIAVSSEVDLWLSFSFSTSRLLFLYWESWHFLHKNCERVFVEAYYWNPLLHFLFQFFFFDQVLTYYVNNLLHF